jgi:hypothetical protein
MSVADIFDGAFKLYKANARTIVIIVATLVIPFQVAGALVQRSFLGGSSVFSAINDPSAAQSTNRPLGTQLAILGLSLINVLLAPFVAGAIAQVVSASYVGNHIGPAEALRAARRRFWPLLGAWWMIHILEITGALFCILPGVALMAMFVCTAPAIVTEHLGPVHGMGRSWQLTRRRFWPMLGIAVLSGVVFSVMGSTLSGIPTLAAFAVGLRWGWILLAAGNSAVSLLTLPLVAIVATLLYFDARIRQEGFDLQLIAAGLANGQR